MKKIIKWLKDNLDRDLYEYYGVKKGEKNIMKKFLRDNKGVIIFYAELVIITLIVVNNL